MHLSKSPIFATSSPVFRALPAPLLTLADSRYNPGPRRRFEPSNEHHEQQTDEGKDLQHEVANEGMYLIVGKDGLELWRVGEDGKNVFTDMVFPNVEAAHSYVFGKDAFLGFR